MFIVGLDGHRNNYNLYRNVFSGTESECLAYMDTHVPDTDGRFVILTEEEFQANQVAFERPQ